MASAKNCLINASSSLSLVSTYMITYAFSAFSGTLAGVFSSFFDEPPRIDAYAAAPIVPNTPRTRCSLGIFIPDPVSVADRRQDRMYRRRNTPLDMFVPVRTVSAEMQHVALATITRTLMHARTPTCFLLQHTCNSVRHISSLYACNGRRSRISGPSALSSQHPPLPRIDPSAFGRDSQLCCKAPRMAPAGPKGRVGLVLMLVGSCALVTRNFGIAYFVPALGSCRSRASFTRRPRVAPRRPKGERGGGGGEGG